MNGHLRRWAGLVLVLTLTGWIVGCKDDTKAKTKAAPAGGASVDVNLSATELTEISSVSATIVLGEDPGADVTVAVSTDDENELEFSVDGGETFAASVEMSFTSSNWDTEQELIVQGKADGVADGDTAPTITIGPSAGSAVTFDEVSSPVTVIDVAGVGTEVPLSEVGSAWSQCFSETYDMSGTLISDILADCSKSYLMLACRPAGTSDLAVAAYAGRDDVTFDTGINSSEVHNANAVSWYFNGSQSWGYTAKGTGVIKGNCDYRDSSVDSGSGNPTALTRLCWHTAGGNALSDG
jgi:hypothetical protein